KYSGQDPRVTLTLSSPEVSASTLAVLEGVFRTLGFESCKRWEALVQGFRGELVRFQEQLDAHGGPVGCALLALVAPTTPKPGAFLTGLGELCGRRLHWSLQLLTSAQCDLSGARAALLLAVTQDRPGAQHDALGFETTLKTDPTAQTFQEEMVHFWEWLDACRGPACRGVSRAWSPPWRLGRVLPSSQPPAALALLTQPSASQDLLSTSSKKPEAQGRTLSPGCGSGCRHHQPPPPPADVLHIYADVQGSFSGGPTPGSSNQADILMVYAATEGPWGGNRKAAGRGLSLTLWPWCPGLGCVAFRDEKGSDFIQMLVEVLRADPREDLLELMTEVSWQVCKLDVLGPYCDEHHKACLEIRSSLSCVAQDTWEAPRALGGPIVLRSRRNADSEVHRP
ncbi:hypothetical protein EI555_019979, partial [Monodon monoceros]